MQSEGSSHFAKIPLAGLLSWLVPGLGHAICGDWQRGAVLFVAITGTFWTGIAIGGAPGTVDPAKRRLWFTAQICTGGNTLAAYSLHKRLAATAVAQSKPLPLAHWMSAEVGVHYTGVAGLLNLLVIFDAIIRADSSTGRRRRLVGAGVVGSDP